MLMGKESSEDPLKTQTSERELCCAQQSLLSPHMLAMTQVPFCHHFLFINHQKSI